VSFCSQQDDYYQSLFIYLCICLPILVVATDDQRIVDAVVAFGGEVRQFTNYEIIVKPHCFILKAMMTSVDCATGSDRCWSVIEQLPDRDQFGIVVNVQVFYSNLSIYL
jgi:CMP-2-keto-3-deoxyoctulosonic acid synthetase